VTEIYVATIDLPLEEVLRVTGGELHPGTGQQVPQTIARVSTDSRALQPGDCFVALRGEVFDAHDFLHQAADAGAGLLVVERPLPNAGVPQIIVKDTLVALGQLAATWRQRYSIPIAGLVGSSGKTTTKEMAAEIVGSTRALLSTRGNLNNLIGLPHMLFSMNDSHEAAILELGMNLPDENRRLVEISNPDCILLTNITHAHVGMFGSLEAHYEAEAEAIRYAPEKCTLLMNVDDEKSMRARRDYAGSRKVITFGTDKPADLRGTKIETLEPYGYRFQLEGLGFAGETVELNMFGKHNVNNAVAAAALARYFDVPCAKIVEVLSAFRPRLNRSEVETIHGWHLVKDFYNAIPAAVTLALESLADFKISGRRFAVLGDMMELGEFEEPYHREVGEVAARSGLHSLYTLGDRGRWIHEAAQSAGLNAVHLADAAAVAAALKAELQPGDLLLLKASRAMKLERLYELLKQ